MIKNAIAYITRKRNRTLIIFIILTIVLSCLYSCLTIMKSSDEIEKALYESSNSSISITRKDGNYFNVNDFLFFHFFQYLVIQDQLHHLILDCFV